MSRLWNKFLSLFIKPKYELWITYKPTDWEGKKETHKFIVRKKIKITPKHIVFLDNDEKNGFKKNNIDGTTRLKNIMS